MHPNHFTPDPKIVEAYGIDTSKPYFVMRFASLNAHHDSGIKGINTEIAQRLIDILEGSYKENGEENILLEENTENKIENIKDTLTKKDEPELTGISSNNLDPKSAQKQAFGQPSAQSCSISLTKKKKKNDIFDIQEKNPKNEMPRIYITSERPLEPQFEKYRIKINPLDMHHVMAFASLYIGDSQTMAAEAGVLGVPFVRFNDFVGRIGYLRELEDTYELGYGIKASAEGSVEKLCERVETLVSMPSSERKATFAARREKMLSDKVDCAKFLTYFIEYYPQSVDAVRSADAEFWEKFK